MSLTFELDTRVLGFEYLLVIVIISAKLYQNPFTEIQIKVGT